MLKFFVDLLSQASILVALFTMVGLILLKPAANEIAAGFNRIYIIRSWS